MPYAPFQQNKKLLNMKYMRQFSNFGAFYDVITYVTFMRNHQLRHILTKSRFKILHFVYRK